MAVEVALRNQMLDLLDQAVQASIHSADPGDTGANQIGARQPITWSAAASGSKATTGPVAFDVPAATTVQVVGLWDAGGVFLAAGPLDTPETFTGAGTYTVNVVTATLT